MPTLEDIIAQITSVANQIQATPTNRKETAALKSQILEIQDACQYAFTAIKQINRKLPD